MRPGPTHAGFTLAELLIVLGVMAVIAAATVPVIAGAMRLYSLNTSVQTVSAAIRAARYTAVSKNRTLRVRFNCPAANEFRIVEVTGIGAIDAAGDRCSAAAYPFPDVNPAARPDVDGPIVYLSQGSQFDVVQDLEINTAGRVTPLTGCPACVVVASPGIVALTNGQATRTITVSASGQVNVS